MNQYTEEELIEELIIRRKRENKDIIILLADDHKEDLHFQAPLESSCRMSALLFSAVIDLLRQRFNLTKAQGRELFYESINTLLKDRINFFGKKTSNDPLVQKIH